MSGTTPITPSAWQTLEQAVISRLAYYKAPDGPLKVVDSYDRAERTFADGIFGLTPAAVVAVMSADYGDMTANRRHRKETVTVQVAILYSHPGGNRSERWVSGPDHGMYLMAQAINGLLMDYSPGGGDGVWHALTPLRQFVDRRDTQFRRYMLEYRTSRTIEPTEIVTPADLLSIYADFCLRNPLDPTLSSEVEL